MVILDSLKYSKTWHQLILLWFFVCPNCCPFSELCDWTKLSSQQRLVFRSLLLRNKVQKADPTSMAKKKNRRSKKKKWLSHLPWSLVKKGLPMPQDRRRYVESCRSLRCIDNEMRLYLKKKKLRIKKTGGLKPARNLTQHNLPYVSQLKWTIWEDSAWNHQKIGTIPSFSVQNVGSVSFDQCFKDISPAHLSIPPILPAAFSLVADVRLGLPPERARSPGKGGPGLAQAVTTLVNNDSRSDDMMSIRSHEIWHQPKLHALFIQGNLSKISPDTFAACFGFPKKGPISWSAWHAPTRLQRSSPLDLRQVLSRGSPQKNSRRFGQRHRLQNLNLLKYLSNLDICRDFSKCFLQHHRVLSQ